MKFGFDWQSDLREEWLYAYIKPRSRGKQSPVVFVFHKHVSSVNLVICSSFSIKWLCDSSHRRTNLTLP